MHRKNRSTIERIPSGDAQTCQRKSDRIALRFCDGPEAAQIRVLFQMCAGDDVQLLLFCALGTTGAINSLQISRKAGGLAERDSSSLDGRAQIIHPSALSEAYGH
jgi:hypothetical protein